MGNTHLCGREGETCTAFLMPLGIFGALKSVCSMSLVSKSHWNTHQWWKLDRKHQQGREGETERRKIGHALLWLQGAAFVFASGKIWCIKQFSNTLLIPSINLPRVLSFPFFPVILNQISVLFCSVFFVSMNARHNHFGLWGLKTGRREHFHWEKERGCVSTNLGYALDLKVFCHSCLRNETTNFVFQGHFSVFFWWFFIVTDDKKYQPMYLFAAWISGL